MDRVFVIVFDVIDDWLEFVLFVLVLVIFLVVVIWYLGLVYVIEKYFLVVVVKMVILNIKFVWVLYGYDWGNN